MKTLFTIIIATVLITISNDIFAQSTGEVQRAIGVATAAVRQECGVEIGDFFYSYGAVSCNGSGFNWIINVGQPTPCYPFHIPCIQVVDHVATVKVDCNYNVTNVTCGPPVIIIEE